MTAPSDGVRNLFPAADRKTVAAGGNANTAHADGKPRSKTGRRRAEVVEAQEREFVKLLHWGFNVEYAQKESGLSDKRALRIVAEFFEGFRAA